MPEVPVNPLPDGLATRLHALFDEFMLVGAHARDRLVHDLAGMRSERRTRDVDVAIVVDSDSDFRKRTAPLARRGTLATSFLVGGVPVDVIPILPATGWTPVDDGVYTDLTGMRDAFDTADVVTVDGVAVRMPTLQAMIALKAVAWLARGDTTDKDAVDLAFLLAALAEGIYEERCWASEDLLGRFDADPARVGAFLTGIDIARDLPSAAGAVLEAVVDHRARLIGSMPPTPHTRRDLFDALADGIMFALGTAPTN